jgi:hypothetical protein
MNGRELFLKSLCVLCDLCASVVSVWRANPPLRHREHKGGTEVFFLYSPRAFYEITRPGSNESNDASAGFRALADTCALVSGGAAWDVAMV